MKTYTSLMTMQVEKFDINKEYSNVNKLYDSEGKFVRAEFNYLEGQTPKQVIFTEDSHIGETNTYPGIWQKVDPESEEFKKNWKTK